MGTAKAPLIKATSATRKLQTLEELIEVYTALTVSIEEYEAQNEPLLTTVASLEQTRHDVNDELRTQLTVYLDVKKRSNRWRTEMRSWMKPSRIECKSDGTELDCHGPAG